ncbi:MAG: DUF1345 domain-containing protein [Actinomycetota bacterium]|nr:DUF1345 domain-containing protein [Actinomycetota bacterium]
MADTPAEPGESPSAHGGGDPSHVAHALRRALEQVEGALGYGVGRVQQAEQTVVPAWKRATAGENRWPVSVVVLIAIALQLRLPDHLALHPRWLLPGVEAILMVGLIAVNPRRIDRRSSPIRAASIVLIVAASIGNAWSAGHLIRAIVTGHAGRTAGPLLIDGGAIWLTNVIVFGLWYWELDRGGPIARAHGERVYPDFQFPQMDNPDLAPQDWEPVFWDYLYVSFTNATAFSPTDALPLTRWTKMAMAVQSAVSLSTVALVVARAVNILR